MTKDSTHYFACGNTAQGFVDYFSSNLQGLDRIFILKGGPGTGKSSLMSYINNAFDNFRTELIHCSSDPDSLDGIIIPDLRLAVVDGTSPHVIEPKTPGAVEEYVNLGAAWDSDKLKMHKNEIMQLRELITSCFENAYKCFAEGFAIHNELEEIYHKNMDFSKADKVADDTINAVLGDNYFHKSPFVKHRFFAATTPVGTIDYIQSLTGQLSKRYLLKGRPGTGKSTLLKKVAAESIKRGLDTEIYHCAFDSNSVDMVLLPEADICIFDSTALDSYEPLKRNDEIIDMYENCVRPGTDEKYARDIQGIIARYKIAVNSGIRHLADAKRLHDETEKYYTPAMDFNKINAMRDEILYEAKGTAQKLAP